MFEENSIKEPLVLQKPSEISRKPLRENLEFAKSSELRGATPEEISQVIGLTDSANEVSILVDETGKFVLKKEYIDLNSALAKNEIKALRSLERSKFLTVKIPKIYQNSQVEVNKGTGNLYILLELEKNYTSLAGDNTFFEEALFDLEPTRLIQIIEGIRQIHELGVIHGDLHLNNVGTILDNSGENQIMIIDFQEASMGLNDEQLDEGRIKDMLQFGIDFIDSYADTHKDEAKMTYLELLEEYYPELDVEELEQELEFLLDKKQK